MRANFFQVIFMDADNMPLQVPEALFRTPEYLEHGNLFWPDFWNAETSLSPMTSAAYELLGLEVP